MDFYNNASEKSSSEITCPTCGSEATKIYHCVKCGKAVCQQCMVVSADDDNVYCEDCW